MALHINPPNTSDRRPPPPVTIERGLLGTRVAPEPTGEADRLLVEVARSGLGSGANKHDHCCQFCGHGPHDPFTGGHDHGPGCLWGRIEAHLKARGLL